MAWTRVMAVLMGLSLAASCAPPTSGPPDAELLTGFEQTEDFTVLSGTNGSFDEVRALVAQPRASMQAYAVDSMTEMQDLLEALGVTRGATAVVRDAEGRHYHVIGTSAGTLLVEISSFFSG